MKINGDLQPLLVRSFIIQLLSSVPAGAHRTITNFCYIGKKIYRVNDHCMCVYVQQIYHYWWPSLMVPTYSEPLGN